MLKETKREIQKEVEYFNRMLDLKDKIFESLKDKLTKKEFDLIFSTGEMIANQTIRLDKLNDSMNFLNNAIKLDEKYNY